MGVQSLEAFGVHPDVLRAWENNYSKELLPVQAEAVAAREVLSGTVGQEDFGIDVAEDSFGGAVLAVTLQLTAQGEPTLVFVKDRRNSVQAMLPPRRTRRPPSCSASH